jgi:hypothetical protein
LQQIEIAFYITSESFYLFLLERKNFVKLFIIIKYSLR